MTIELIPIGGYSEIGRNCTAIKIDNKIIILDMGIHLENYINYTEDKDRDEFVNMTQEALIEVDAIPNTRIIDSLKKNVVAICISHAHLDHLGAIPFLANDFKCPIYGTPFTIELLNEILKNEKVDLRNELIKKNVNSRFKVSDNIEIEFINVTHSTPQTVMIAIHSKYGTLLYANDIKLDPEPILGEKTNLKRVKELDVNTLILNCLYTTTKGYTQSESVPTQKLREILLETDNKGKSIFITTFSSQIARIKTIKTLGKKLGRKVVFLGRSLSKYAFAAENAEITNFSDVKIVKYSSKVRKFLNQIANPKKYLFVVTGNQGEPNATLSKIVYNNYFHFKNGDIVIFSCTIIPVQENEINRERLEAALKQKHVKIYRDIHASGHARHEDHRELIKIIKPKHLLPVHGDIPRMKAMKELAIEEGLKSKNVHILKNGEKITLD